MKPMKLEQLQHFMSIVEHGSLRAAARRLDMPQPALTRSVRALERGLGGMLFARQTTGMQLTAEGQRFHLRACAIVNEMRRAKEEMQSPGADYSGSVSVALSIMPHLSMLAYALPLFRQAYPNVNLEITESLLPAVEGDLREGSLDFYLGAAPRLKPSAGLRVDLLSENSRIVIGRKKHPLSRAKSLKSLDGAEWGTTAIDHKAEEDLTRLFRLHGLAAPRVMVRAHSALSLMVVLAHTDLLAMVPRQWLESDLTCDALHMISIKEALPAPNIVLVRRPDFPLSPPAELLADLMMRRCQQKN